jgi:hypothetical protein
MANDSALRRVFFPISRTHPQFLICSTEGSIRNHNPESVLRGFRVLGLEGAYRLTASGKVSGGSECKKQNLRLCRFGAFENPH